MICREHGIAGLDLPPPAVSGCLKEQFAQNWELRGKKSLQREKKKTQQRWLVSL